MRSFHTKFEHPAFLGKSEVLQIARAHAAGTGGAGLWRNACAPVPTCLCSLAGPPSASCRGTVALYSCLISPSSQASQRLLWCGFPCHFSIYFLFSFSFLSFFFGSGFSSSPHSSFSCPFSASRMVPAITHEECRLLGPPFNFISHGL